MSYEIATRERYEYAIELPDGVTASFALGELTITGPKGAVTRRLQSKDTIVAVDGSRITLTTRKATKRFKREAHTFRSHVQNMIRGSTEGHTYTLKIASSHFPITVQQQGEKIVVKNFVGEKKARELAIPEGVSVKVSGDTVEVTGTDIVRAGNFAGALEKLCARPSFDNRIFQDGIYIVEKDGKRV